MRYDDFTIDGERVGYDEIDERELRSDWGGGAQSRLVASLEEATRGTAFEAPRRGPS